MTRTIECSECGSLAAHKARGLCDRCYRKASPRQVAKTRWRHMINRCTDPQNADWKNYGARGIKVCDRWLSFDAYYQDVGDAPAGMSLDRINNDGGYEPGNVRWATPTEQTRNRRPLNVTHCPQGHPYDVVNTYVTPRGSRDCRTCRRESSRRAHLRRIGAAA